MNQWSRRAATNRTKQKHFFIKILKFLIHIHLSTKSWTFLSDHLKTLSHSDYGLVEYYIIIKILTGSFKISKLWDVIIIKWTNKIFNDLIFNQSISLNETTFRNDPFTKIIIMKNNYKRKWFLYSYIQGLSVFKSWLNSVLAGNYIIEKADGLVQNCQNSKSGGRESRGYAWRLLKKSQNTPDAPLPLLHLQMNQPIRILMM